MCEVPCVVLGKAELVFSGVTYPDLSLCSISPEFRRANLWENHSVCPEPSLPVWKMGLLEHLQPELVLAESVEWIDISLPPALGSWPGP